MEPLPSSTLQLSPGQFPSQTSPGPAILQPSSGSTPLQTSPGPSTVQDPESGSRPCTPTPTLKTRLKRSKQKKRASDIDVEIEGLDKMVKKLSDIREPDDEGYLFAQSLIPTFRQLSAYKLALAKQRIQNALFEVEFTEENLSRGIPVQQVPTSHTQYDGYTVLDLDKM